MNGSASLVVRALDHLVMNVRDVEMTVGWYRRVLGMTRSDSQPSGDGPARTSLHFGTQKINVRPVATDPHEWFTGARPAAGSDDLCFLTDDGPEAVLAHLRVCDVAVELGPVEKQGARGRLRSVYCRDPDGNLIEISSYATVED